LVAPSSRDLWSTRQESERALDANLKPLADLLMETFTTIDECVIRLDGLDNSFGRVTALVLIKGRNLAFGCYSLSLDALAQEAGALFRPFIETVELLTYLRSEPRRVNEALENRLPKAGEIAHRIGAGLKDLRAYLNAHASHLSVSEHAMRHLIDFSAGQLKPVQLFSEPVLRENLRMLLASVVWLMAAGVNCLSVGAGQIDEAFVDRAERIRMRALELVGR
jgi:hypothetical protein